jgi:hypothetical protein
MEQPHMFPSNDSLLRLETKKARGVHQLETNKVSPESELSKTKRRRPDLHLGLETSPQPKAHHADIGNRGAQSFLSDNQTTQKDGNELLDDNHEYHENHECHDEWSRADAPVDEDTQPYDGSLGEENYHFMVWF